MTQPFLIVNHDIVLHLLEPTDAETLFELVDRNRDHLRPWVFWIDTTLEVADSRRFIETSQHKRENNNGYALSIWYRNNLAGLVGHVDINWTHRSSEIGYWLGDTYQGHGIITRACRAFISWTFRTLDMNRVQIQCAIDNTRSQAVAERLGFQREGVLREMRWLHSRFVDYVVYSMLAREWNQHL